MNTSYINSVVGPLKVVTENNTLIEISFLDTLEKEIINNEDLELLQQIKDLTAGKRKDFTFPIQLEGTDFQKQVWNALLDIPYGETKTYKEIAESIGNPKAVRAVGNANNKNKIPIVVPCHRVIGANGSLVGYAGGLDKKKLLLKTENKA